MKLHLLSITMVLLTINPFSKELPDRELDLSETVENKPAKIYVLTGTFVLGTLTYTYEIHVDADICIICNPPKIKVNGITQITICLQGTTICGTATNTRIVNENDNTVRLDFESTELDPEIVEYLNSTEFLSILRNDILESEN